MMIDWDEIARRQAEDKKIAAAKKWADDLAKKAEQDRKRGSR